MKQFIDAVCEHLDTLSPTVYKQQDRYYAVIGPTLTEWESYDKEKQNHIRLTVVSEAKREMERRQIRHYALFSREEEWPTDGEAIHYIAVVAVEMVMP